MLAAKVCGPSRLFRWSAASCNAFQAVALFLAAFRKGPPPMNFRAPTTFIALSALAFVLTTTAVPAAELALAPMHDRSAYVHHHAAYVRTGLVFWDDVYPPAIYGPQLRSVEEVAVMKAEARPVSQRWWGYWYVR